MESKYWNREEIVSRPKFFADVNERRPSNYSDYENFVIEWSPQDDYQVVRKIGRGRYSDVFQGINVVNKKSCAIKILKPVRKLKINREIKILQSVSGGPNIVKLLDVCRDPAKLTPSLIMEYVDNTEFRVLFDEFGDFEVRSYLYQLLNALDHTHKNGIIHRDVKPNNIIYNRTSGELRLADWGLADFYFPGKKYNVRVSTRYFKPPELLLNYPYYHYSLDMWSFGCVMAGMIFKKEPFFKGRNDNDQLKQILHCFDPKDLQGCMNRYDIKLSIRIEKAIRQVHRPGWKQFINNSNFHLASPEAVDLLGKLLVLDHSQRLFPHEAKQHPYFEPVRTRIEETKGKKFTSSNF